MRVLVLPVVLVVVVVLRAADGGLGAYTDEIETTPSPSCLFTLRGAVPPCGAIPRPRPAPLGTAQVSARQPETRDAAGQTVVAPLTEVSYEKPKVKDSGSTGLRGDGLE